LLLDPKTPPKDSDRAQKLEIMASTPPGIDLVWDAFRNKPERFPSPLGMVGSFMVSPYRTDLDRLLDSEHFLTPELRAQGKAMAQKGSSQTLATVTQQIHDFLVRRGYQHDATPAWNLAP
jgi:hypothetical protein